MDVFEYLLFCVIGGDETVRGIEAGEEEDIEEVVSERGLGDFVDVVEEDRDVSYLPDVMDLSMEEAFERFGSECVFLAGEELDAFVMGYGWEEIKTDWVDPEVGESVVGNELSDWVYDYRRRGVEGDGRWFRLVARDRKRVPEPGSRESFEELLRRSDECGWRTFLAAGCLMIGFRDLRSGWKGDSGWIRNEDPRAGLVLCDDGRWLACLE